MFKCVDRSNRQIERIKIVPTILTITYIDIFIGIGESLDLLCSCILSPRELMHAEARMKIVQPCFSML